MAAYGPPYRPEASSNADPRYLRLRYEVTGRRLEIACGVGARASRSCVAATAPLGPGGVTVVGRVRLQEP